MIVSICIGILIISIYWIHRHFFPPIPHLQKKYDYALLLGCPTHDDGTLSTSQIQRCQLAIQAYHEQQFKTLVISGGAVKSEYIESCSMKEYIQQHSNIPILCETKARNTFENFQFSKKIIQEHSVLVLTSQTHARRSCAIAHQFFKQYSCRYTPDHKLKHWLREIYSRILYIKIELKK